MFLHGRAENDDESTDWAGLAVGSHIVGSVQDVKEYGALIDLAAYPDLVGLAAPHQKASRMWLDTGSSICALAWRTTPTVEGLGSTIWFQYIRYG